MQFLLAILLVAFQNNQTTSPANTPTEKRECQVAGTVVAQEGGEVIKNARLALRQEVPNPFSSKHLSLKTGEDGKFCFSDVPPGRYRLIIQRNGYVAQTYGEDDPSSSGPILAVSKEKKLEGLAVKLVRAGVITGKILDEDGEPATGIMVQALLPEDSWEGLWEADGKETSSGPKNGFVSTQATLTNDLGEYRLAGLSPGEYIINAVDSGGALNGTNFALSSFLFTEDEVLDKSAPTYYPGATHVEQAEKIPLKAGAVVSADIQLHHEKMVTVSGIVMREDGKPGSKSMVLISDENSINSSFTRTSSQADENGHFSISQVLPGSYTVTAASFERDDMAEGQCPPET